MMEARGAVNCYVCEKCRCFTMTINMSAGVTSFMCRCAHCDGMAQSSFYKFRPPTNGGVASVTVQEMWYRPVKKWFDTADAETQRHILRGGLIKAPLGTHEILCDALEVNSSTKEIADFMESAYGCRPDFKDPFFKVPAEK